MINKSIKNWIAVTKDNEYITINKVKNNKEDYYCPCCNEILRGRALESEVIQPHFYHLQNDNLKSCNYENAYRRYWKDNLITLGEIIKVPFLNNITCIELKHNYKVGEDLIADIYIKTNDNRNILFLFAQAQGNYINVNYDIFYIDFMSIELNKSNLYNCIEFIHSADIDNLNIKFKSYLIDLQKRVNNTTTKETIKLKVDINKYKSLQQELNQLNYLKEASLIDDIIISLENKQKEIYKYKNQTVEAEELKRLNDLIVKLINTTKLNRDLDINILKRIDYNIYKNNWNRFIYFDFIKPISNFLKEHIKQLENII